MQQLIIDSDFYTNAEQMRELFVNLDFAKNENMLGGQICPMQFANQDMLGYIQHIIGVPQGVEAFEFVPGSGSFIINTETDPPTRSVCTQFPDPLTQWVGVVDLSNTPNPHYLKFYRNNRTGWDGIPTDPNELSKEKLYSLDHVDTFLEYENADWESKWTETSRIELKFNQLVLFRPGSFHSYNDVFGDSKTTGRMLQFFFLKPKTTTEAQPEPAQDLTPQE